MTFAEILEEVQRAQARTLYPGLANAAQILQKQMYPQQVKTPLQCAEEKIAALTAELERNVAEIAALTQRVKDMEAEVERLLKEKAGAPVGVESPPPVHPVVRAIRQQRPWQVIMGGMR